MPITVFALSKLSAELPMCDKRLLNHDNQNGSMVPAMITFETSANGHDWSIRGFLELGFAAGYMSAHWTFLCSMLLIQHQSERFVRMVLHAPSCGFIFHKSTSRLPDDPAPNQKTIFHYDRLSLEIVAGKELEAIKRAIREFGESW